MIIRKKHEWASSMRNDEVYPIASWRLGTWVVIYSDKQGQYTTDANVEDRRPLDEDCLFSLEPYLFGKRGEPTFITEGYSYTDELGVFNDKEEKEMKDKCEKKAEDKDSDEISTDDEFRGFKSICEQPCGDKPKRKPENPYEIWEKYWSLSCDWKVVPEGWQGWNGGIETATNYMVELLLGVDGGSIESYDKAIALKEKIHAKLLDK